MIKIPCGCNYGIYVFFLAENTEKEKRGKVDNFYGWQRHFPSSLISVEVTSAILVCSQNVNALTAVGALVTLIDFTGSNARRFYSSMGNPLVKNNHKVLVIALHCLKTNCFKP